VAKRGGETREEASREKGDGEKQLGRLKVKEGPNFRESLSSAKGGGIL